MSSNNETMDNVRGNRPPLFRKMNYILMGVGALLLIIGGKVPDEVFDGEIFNTRRLVVAPILIFLGLATEIVAIMWHPKVNKTDNE